MTSKIGWLLTLGLPEGGTCAIIQRVCYVFITDYSINVSPLLDHVRTQVIALSDLTLRLVDRGSDHGALGGKSCCIFWQLLP